MTTEEAIVELFPEPVIEKAKQVAADSDARAGSDTGSSSEDDVSET